MITPLFGEEAILSFNALEKDHYMELSFTVNGAEMEYGYSRKAMVEINPGIDEDLDIVEIVLTVDEYGTPKNMSTKLSMTRLKNEGDVLAKKTIWIMCLTHLTTSALILEKLSLNTQMIH